jgi:hypothetical protein
MGGITWNVKEGLKGFSTLGGKTKRGIAIKFFSAHLSPMGGEKFL